MTRHTRLQLLFLIPAVPLAWFAFREVPVDALRDWTRGFNGAGLGGLLLFEAASWLMMGERWRYFCREAGANVPLWTAAAVRLAGFAWSYITPGPHFGGEPVQILTLSRRGYPASRTLPALIRDRGYELFAGLLTASLLLVLPGAERRQGVRSVIVATVLVLIVTVLSLHEGAFRAMARVILSLSGKQFGRRRRIYGFLASTFRPPQVRVRPPAVRCVLALSLFTAPLLIITEIAMFFALSASPVDLRAILVLAAVSRITHYAPVPGAAGVYDAGIIGAAAWLQLDVGTAAAYVLFTRLRDLVQVTAGLAIAAAPDGSGHGR